MAKRPDAAGEAWLDLRPDFEAEDTFRLVQELPERLRAFKRMIMWYAADYVLTSVLGKVPKQPQYAGITDNLSIAEVASREPSFAVHVRTRSKKVRKIDSAKTVIYVRAKKSLTRPPNTVVKVLEDMGPWTMDTIPFWPSSKNAVVIQRKVRKQEADNVAAMQKRQLASVKRELARLGKRPISKKKDSRIKRGKAIQDVAMIALNLEFGDGDSRSIPAWRTSILDLATQTKHAMRDYPQIKAAISDPNNRKWKSWPRVKDKIGRTQVKSYVGFMKKITG